MRLRRTSPLLSISAKYLTGQAPVKSAALDFFEIFNGAGRLTQTDSGLSARLYPILKKPSAVQANCLNDGQSILKTGERPNLL